jgi:hypothetical protein
MGPEVRMKPDRSDHVEIDTVFYSCGKLKRAVLITYLATSSHCGVPADRCVPEMTAFDCSQKHACGVCAPEGRWVSCRWERCVHPGLSEQDPCTE